MFVVTPTNPKDSTFARQLQAVMNIQTNQRAYQELVAKPVQKVLLKDGWPKKDVYA